MPGSVASHLQKLPEAPAISGQLWAKAEPWPLYVCQGVRSSCVTIDELLLSPGFSCLIWKQEQSPSAPTSWTWWS